MTPPKRTIDRVLLGLVFAGAAVSSMWLQEGPGPDNEAATAFVTALEASGLFHVILFGEIVGGVALIAGRFVPLAVSMLAPVLFGIVFFHITLEPSGLPFALVLVALWGAVVSAHWEAFAPLLRGRPETP